MCLKSLRYLLNHLVSWGHKTTLARMWPRQEEPTLSTWIYNLLLNKNWKSLIAKANRIVVFFFYIIKVRVMVIK